MQSKLAIVWVAGMLGLALPARAQDCGWLLPPGDSMPATLQKLLARPGGEVITADVLVPLRDWTEECREPGASIAIQELRRIERRHRSNTVVDAALAILLARGPEVQVPRAPGRMMRAAHSGSLAEREALRRFDAVLSRNAWGEAAQELAELALATRGKQALRTSREVLSRPELLAQPGVATLLAELHLASEGHASAERYGRMAMAHGDSMALRVIGMAQLLSNEPTAGADAYLAGMTFTAATTQYYDDLFFLLDPDEKADWDTIPASRRAAWLRTAWEWRASRAGVTIAERLRLHFERLHFARRVYARQSFRGAPPPSGRWFYHEHGALSLDDRGLAYVRHGAPEQEVRMVYPGAMRLAWLYGDLDGRVGVLEFDKRATWPNYYLADPTTECLDSANFRDVQRALGLTTDPRARARYAAAKESYNLAITHLVISGALRTRPIIPRSGMTFADLLTDAVVACEYQSRVEIGQPFVTGAALRRAIRTAVFERETAYRRFDRPIDLLMNTYAFRGREQTELVVWAALDAGILRAPAAEQERQEPQEQAGVPLRLFAAVEYPTERRLVRFDSVAAIQPGGAARERVEVRVSLPATPAGNADVRFSIRSESDSTQGGMVSTTRSIPDLAHAEFALSDVVVTRRDGAARWRRGQLELQPVPGHWLEQGQAFGLFFEVYGAQAGVLQTEISLIPTELEQEGNVLEPRPDEQAMAALRFVDQVMPDADGVTRILKDVSLDVSPGSYTIEVVVRDPRGARVANARTLVGVVAQ